MRTQDFAEHHYYLILPMVLILLNYQAAQTIHWAREKARSWAGCGVAGLYFLFVISHFAVTFIPAYQPLAPLKGWVHSWYTMYPKTRNDMDEIERLLAVLEKELEPEATVYVLASSPVLSDNLLRDAHLVFDRPVDIRERILSGGHVDKVHGFPRGLLNCDIAVITDPPQSHLGKEEQRNVWLPCELLMNGEGIGRHFTKLPYSITLDKGVRAFLYRRERDLPKEDILALEEAFISFHPDFERKYRVLE